MMMTTTKVKARKTTVTVMRMKEEKVCIDRKYADIGEEDTIIKRKVHKRKKNSLTEQEGKTLRRYFPVLCMKVIREFTLKMKC